MTTALHRRGLGIIALLLAFWVVPPALAMDFNVNDDGVILHGYDPVSYFTADNPTKGLEKFSTKHHGARYLFSLAENRDTFVADPERYAPQFGGYCAYGVRVGRNFDVDPDVYRVVDDKLYLQLNWGTQVVWLSNKDENIEVAHTLWPMIGPKTDEELALAAEKQAKN
jgi:hypothetical protein